MAKVYRVLDPGELRTTCNFVLPNKMQCWQFGAQEITEVVRGPDNQPLTLVYQYCERHVKIQQAIDTGQLPAKESGSPLRVDKEQEAQHRLGVELADKVSEALSKQGA